MKKSALLLSSVLIFFAITSVGEEMQMHKMCHFNIAGTWQSFTDGQLNLNRERFGANGVMTELRHGSGKGSGWHAVGESTFKFDNAMAPKSVTITPFSKNGESAASTTLQIKTFDDGLFLTATDDSPSATLTRWTRVDPYRYFVVLAAGKGDPGFGGPGFAMLIKTDGVHTVTDAFGVYPVVNPLERHPMIGIIPVKIRKNFDKEPVGDTGSMLRLEVTAGPYTRALEVMKTWERRVDDNTLLYTVPYLNNAVYLNQLASSLNEIGVLGWEGGTPCTETIKLQKLTWGLHDPIMTKHNMTQTPYYLFKMLREKNESLHLDDTKFHLALAGEQTAPVVISSR